MPSFELTIRLSPAIAGVEGFGALAHLPPDHLARLRVDRQRVALERVHVEDAVAVARRVLDVLAEAAGPERLAPREAEVDRGAREVAAGAAAEHRPAALVDARSRRGSRRRGRRRCRSGRRRRGDHRHVRDLRLERALWERAGREERDADPGHEGEDVPRGMKRSRRRMDAGRHRAVAPTSSVPAASAATAVLTIAPSGRAL